MWVVTVIIIIDLCSNFPRDSLCALGTDIPWILWALWKWGRNAQEGEMFSSWYPQLTSSSRRPSCQGNPVCWPQHHSILGWVILCCRVGVGGTVICIVGCSAAAWLPLTGCLWPPGTCGNQNVQALPDVIYSKSLTPGLTYYTNREEKEHTQQCKETQSLCKNPMGPKSQWNNVQSLLKFILK